jgi:uncharacterized protein involved in outer membrane biogenesis
MRRILIGVGIVLVVLVLAAFVWARSILTGEVVRNAVAAQMARALGQPVQIGRLTATVLPRVTMQLHDVRIGEPARILVARLDVGTDVRALLSRRIEHATAHVRDARIDLPLPAFRFRSRDAAQSRGAPVELVSVDRIRLDDVQVVSGGRSLGLDAELASDGATVAIRQMTVSADRTTLDVTGRMTDLEGPAGDLVVQAGSLDFTALMPFVTDFARGATAPATPDAVGGRPTGDDRPGLSISAVIEAERALFGALGLDKLTGRARISVDAVTLESLRFGLFDGVFEGPLTLTLARTPGFRIDGRITGMSVASALAFAGVSEAITGRLSARVALSGTGFSAAEVLNGTRGSVRLDVNDGTVKNLGLVRSVVVATSMRAGAKSDFSTAGQHEPFSRLAATLTVGGGTAVTNDLRFESPDVLWSASGRLRLDGTEVDLSGPLQLSEGLSKEAGPDLLRYTREDGRVTLPVHVTGSLDNLSTTVNLGEALKRAIRNRAIEEANEAIDAVRDLLKR